MMNKVLLSQRFSTIIHKQIKKIFWDFVEREPDANQACKNMPSL